MHYNYNSRLTNHNGRLFPGDAKITACGVSRPRTKEQIEQVGLWASCSEEKSLNQMLENVEVLENTHAKTM